MLVSIAVETYFMASISDFGQLIGKRFDAVGWREESSLDVVLVVQLEQTVDAYGGAVDAS